MCCVCAVKDTFTASTVYFMHNNVWSCTKLITVDVEIFTVNLFSLYSRLVNNREIKLTLIIQRQLQYYSISATIVKIKYAK